jgi:hypothetical protein
MINVKCENYFLIFLIAADILLNFLETVFSLKIFLLTPRMISGCKSLKASAAFFASPALIWSSTFFTKVLILLFLALLTLFFAALERNAFFAADVLAIV